MPGALLSFDPMLAVLIGLGVVLLVLGAVVLFPTRIAPAARSSSSASALRIRGEGG